MKISQYLFLFLCLFSAAAGAQSAADDAVDQADLEKLQGDWQISMVYLYRDGKVGRVAGAELSIRGNQYEETNEGLVVRKGSIELHTDKTPRQIDVRITGGMNQKEKGQLMRGIYKFTPDGPTLNLSFPGINNRPQQFTPWKAKLTAAEADGPSVPHQGTWILKKN